MENILEITDLKTYFFAKDSTVKAVDGVSFNLRKGETFGLVGESGCGKSATCRSIIRLVRQPGRIVSGEIQYKGKDIVKLPEEEMRKLRGKEIGMIFQEPMTALNPVLKIKEQIFEAFEGKKMTKDEKYNKAIELLKLVGIPAPEVRIEEYAHQFSGGMRQRVMIAIVLAAEPTVLLADEPTTALDVTIQDQIIKLMNQLKEKLGMSVILVTHDLGVVAQMCDRLAVMYAGYIMEITDTVTLFSTPRHPYTYGLLSSLPTGNEKGGRLEPIQGAPPDLSNLPPGCPFAPRCHFADVKCMEKMPDLKEIAPGHLSRCHYIEKMDGIHGLIEAI
ncbi:ABC transporter ATP-binding protein [Paenibacillus sp. GP183]|uniref:ABC transporter ATP-binding protein n=1 Tax=Paenibacillus sp. GP183 TaxID=1882751 RepID=UPI000B83F491|nr:ABC transporter ATP-binding protein [Paenibacillus sp. GP183]